MMVGQQNINQRLAWVEMYHQTKNADVVFKDYQTWVEVAVAVIEHKCLK